MEALVLRFSAKVAGAAVLVSMMGVAPALAGHDGCHGRAIECYEKVRTANVYATQARSVVVRPAYSEVVQTPPVVINQTERFW